MTFVDQDFTDETKPAYIVYSYNLDIENINYNDIVDATIADMYAEDSTAEPAVAQVGGNRRRKRAAKGPVGGNRLHKRSTPHCRVNDLFVSGSSIYREMLGVVVRGDFQVLHPTTYNAGICGGSCSTTVLPSTLSGHHAPFVHLLLQQASFQSMHGYNFERCCAPVQYKPMSVLTNSEAGVQISTIPNLQIQKCECLDIIRL